MRNAMLASILTGFGLFAAPSANAACSNAYFPSGVGSSWTYKNTDGDADAGTYTMTVTKNTGSTVTIHVKGDVKDAKSGNSTPLDTDVVGTCTSEGLKMDFSAIGMAARGKNGGGMTMKTISQDGVAFPTADKLKTGYSWTDTRTVEMSGMPMPPQAQAHGAPAGGAMQMTAKTTHTVAGTEKVTTPAGTFDALKITEELEMQMPGMGGGPGGAGGMKSQRTTWLAKGVGIVKGEANIMGQNHGQELEKYTAK